MVVSPCYVLLAEGKQGDKGGNPNGGQGGGYDPQSGGTPKTVNDLGSALAEVYNTNG